MSLVLKAQVATLDEGTGLEKDADISSEIVLMKSIDIASLRNIRTNAEVVKENERKELFNQQYERKGVHVLKAYTSKLGRLLQGDSYMIGDKLIAFIVFVLPSTGRLQNDGLQNNICDSYHK
ncbi:hypothetical protein Tco_1247161 [Tanacetum coccineum]